MGFIVKPHFLWRNLPAGCSCLCRATSYCFSSKVLYRVSPVASARKVGSAVSSKTKSSKRPRGTLSVENGEGDAEPPKVRDTQEKTSLVVVESSAKAATIQKMLPTGKYRVEACFGHVRDLPSSAKQIPVKYKKESWARLGIDVEHDFRPLYVTIAGRRKIISTLRTALAKSSELVLATDEDREGEAISWHLVQLLQPDVPVKRAVFHEITKEAITEAFSSFREVNYSLVEAQEARRILDRLTGFTVSPLLWTTFGPKLSAGRVQSVALSLVVEREKERLRFRTSSFWNADAILSKDGAKFSASLQVVDGKRVAIGKDFDPATGGLISGPKKASAVLVLDEQKIKYLFASVSQGISQMKVQKVTRKRVSRSPPSPLITSTLQQASFSRLRLSATRTMIVAQELYERGFITYMRTDNPNISKAARAACEERIKALFGTEYIGEPRVIKAKSHSQEAHEAIRPAGKAFVPPSETGLESTALALYKLIYERTLASQMSPAELDRTSVDIVCDNLLLRATGSAVVFPGFFRAVEDSVAGSEDEVRPLDEDLLPPGLSEGDLLEFITVNPVERRTKPPARYNDASLVKTLENIGVGRPSTYASIVETLIARGYAQRLPNRGIAPNLVAFAVKSLLANHVPSLLSADFTADMETKLDRIAAGDYDRTSYLTEYYLGAKGLQSIVERAHEEIDRPSAKRIDLAKLASNLRESTTSSDEPNILVGPYGPYIEHDGVIANLPKSTLVDELKPEFLEYILERAKNPVIGRDADGKEILLKAGRYGSYVQLGRDDEVRPGEKPKRVRIVPGMDARDVDIELARKLLALPRVLGYHPEWNKEVIAAIGRFGPYAVCDGNFVGLKDWDHLLGIELNEAVQMINESVEKKRTRQEAKERRQKNLKTRRNIKQGAAASEEKLVKKVR